MSKRIVMFNHKGGVSKTTSAYNIGWNISKKHKVLLVDADPQCNLSSLILGDRFDEYYFDKKTAAQNIRDGVAATFEGKPVPISAVDCVTPSRAKNLYLLAGHANLSEYDAPLTFAQTASNALTVLQNLPGAFSRLIELTEQKYAIEYTVIDLNPGLSAINQNLFLVSDGFIVPTNPDPFSISALNTLKTILPRWGSWKKDSMDLFATSAYPLPTGLPKLIGTLIQRFNIRKGQAARPYRDNIDEIKEITGSELFPALDRASMTLDRPVYGSIASDGFCLGEIPDFQGLLPKAHQAGVPVFDLRNNEINETGPVLDGFKTRRDAFKKQFQEISSKVVDLVDHA